MVGEIIRMNEERIEGLAGVVVAGVEEEGVRRRGLLVGIG